MRRTLLLIPHDIAGLPIFGLGWALLILLIAVGIYLGWESRKGGLGAGNAFRQIFGFAATAAVILVFVVPRTELVNIDGDPVGVAVRGYGMFLMAAAVASVGLAAWRAERAGLGADSILQLAPWTFIGGLIGARIFYVTQYYEDFLRPTTWETIKAMAALNQGGLVVYGGFIGGFLASLVALYRHRTPIWRIGDVIIPCVFVGLFFGRLGCLMNGCCYGGACEPGPLAVRFPAGSQVHAEQLLSGELLGIEGKALFSEGEMPAGQSRWLVESVQPGSLADQAGASEGQELTIALDPSYRDQVPLDRPAEEALPGVILLNDDEVLARFSPQELPPIAEPVWGTQIISSVFAAITFVVLLLVERILHREATRSGTNETTMAVDETATTEDQASAQRGHAGYKPGVLMLVGFIAYGVLRIVLEWIRVDEKGQFGTALSISQWVSLVVITASIVTLVIRLRSGSSGTTGTAAVSATG
ncbi:prolipoprotein diacylglyceryl transferase [Rhodopirellula sp. JC740]|uniref:Phosphatidylglycerol--prolipoprotein diacylglyceryl transferase n=1 Tax=Rhodopirellula halodulae TaxID=2894198 RepID=A0ABS8NJW3_9BACT|nr:prolipoprotein diacylglyceryl transferase family protein [Rhodopirellula sp. JC740]MCC9643863.1 prolipoprotein diacylglyceryl transferase [Rhodopirellula sp. JC740]